MENMYAADGTKLRVRYYLSSGALDKERNYFSGFEYEKAQTGNLAMTQFPMSEGRVTCSGGTYVYEYQMKDHLGNVRASFICASGSPSMQREDYYYPFGLSFRMQDAASANRYLYNGKEKEDFHNLGWNDYGARFYDPQLGRWHALEPKEQFHASYSFCDNNPSNLRDVGGKFVVSGTVATRFDMPQFTVLTGVEAFTSWVGLGSMLIRSIHNDPAYRPSVADYLIAVTLAGFGKILQLGKEAIPPAERAIQELVANKLQTIGSVAVTAASIQNVHNISQDAGIFTQATKTTVQLKSGEIVPLASYRTEIKQTKVYDDIGKMEITQETVLELNPKIAAEKGSSAESFFDLKLNEIGRDLYGAYYYKQK